MIRIRQPVIRARELLRLHRETYRVFCARSDAAVDHAMLHGKLWTAFGWTVQTGTNPNPRFLRNFLMQGNGVEMLRLACCLLVDAGIRVCAPIHDAVLVEAPLESLTEVVRRTQQIMSNASAIVLNGFRLRSDAEIFCYPDHYMDERGRRIWETVIRIIVESDSHKPGRRRPGELGDPATLPARSRPPVPSIVYCRSR